MPPSTPYSNDSSCISESESTIRGSAAIVRESLSPCSLSPACGLWCVVGLDGYFKQINSAFIRRLGWTAEELLARPFVEFIHPDDRVTTSSELVRLEAAEGPKAFQNRFAHRDGAYLWLEWNTQPVGSQPLVQASARDVTAQRQLEREILEISDRERDRLGRDLHDGLCQKLAGIAALSTALSRQLGPHSEHGSVASEIASLLGQAVSEARDLARGLNPVNLDGSGLIGALDNLTANTQSLFRISCTFRCNRSLFWLGEEVETHLYRIVQEAVQNALSHGRATRIFVTLSFGVAKGLLIIRDNGTGIKAGHKRGNGMHTMEYRARLIDASLSLRPVFSGHRRGTRVACVFSHSSSNPKLQPHD